jgi:hypothetical protein
MQTLMRADLQKCARDALAFLDWWKRELVQAVPVAVRMRLFPMGRQVTIRLGRHSVELDVTEKDGGRTLRDERALDALEESGWEQMVEQMVDSRCSLEPEARHIWRTQLSLPVRAARNLRSAIALQLPLLSPLNPDILSWSYQVVGRTRERLDICLVMARADVLEAIAAQFEQQGLQPPRIDTQTNAGPVTLRVGAHVYRSQESKRNRIAVLAGVLLLVSIPVTAWIGANALLYINSARLETLRPQAAAVTAEMRKAQLAEARRRAASPLLGMTGGAPVIDDLAAALPEGVWIEALQMEGERNITFRVQGQLDEKSVKDMAARARLLSIVASGPVIADGSGADLTAVVR